MSIMPVLKASLLAAALGAAGAATAVPLNGSVAIGAGSFAETSGLDVRTDFSPSTNGIAGLNASGVTGNFGSFAASQPVTFSAFTVAIPSTAATPSSFTITGANFTFTADRVAVVQATEDFADFFFLGALATTVPGYEGGSASFRASAVRNGTASGGFTVNFGGVLAAPPGDMTGGSGPPGIGAADAISAVFEPASVALLSMGLLGLGLARRRKA